MSILLEPEVEVLTPALLIPLADFLIFGTCLALTLTTKYWLQAIFAPANFVFGHIPILRDVVGQPIKAVEKRVIHWCSEAAIGSEKRVGKAWHTLAQTITGVAELLFALAVVDALIVDHLIRVWAVPTLSHWIAKHLTITKYVKTVVTYPTTGKIGGGIKKGLIGLAAGLTVLGRYVHHHVPALEHGLADLRHRVGHTAARVGQTPSSIRRFGHRLTRLERMTVGLGAVALVAGAMRRMGLGWLRCAPLSRVGRKIGCGGFGVLEEFLSPAFEALLVADLCRFALLTQSVVREIVPELGVFLLVQNAVCLGGGASLPSAADKVSVHTKITLPSAAG